MIKEDYISFETAKLLKDKGFEQHNPDVEMHYRENGEYSDVVGDEVYQIDSMYSAPTHQMAMKWLREEHGIIITIDFDEYELTSDNKKVGYGYNIQKVETPTKYFTISTMVYDSYEESVEAAIEYTLKKLL